MVIVSTVLNCNLPRIVRRVYNKKAEFTLRQTIHHAQRIQLTIFRKISTKGVAHGVVFEFGWFKTRISFWAIKI